MFTKSLRVKVAATHIVVSFISVVAFAFAMHYVMTGRLYTIQQKELEYMAANEADVLRDNISDHAVMMDKIMYSREFTDYSVTDRGHLLKKYFYAFTEDFFSLSYVDSRGFEQVKMVRDGAAEEALGFIGDMPLFQEAMENPNKAVLSPVKIDALSGEAGIMILIAKYSYFDEFIGALAGVIPLSDMIREIKQVGEDDNIFLSIVDRDGIVVLHPDDDSVSWALDVRGNEAGKILSDIRDMARGFGRAVLSGVDGITAYAPLEDTGWSIMVTLPYEEFRRASVTAVEISLVFFIVIAGVSVVLSIIISRNLVEPFSRLAGVINKVAYGDFSEKVRVRSYDEIETLADSFNKMIDNLQKTTVSVKVLEAAQRRFQDVVENIGEYIWEVDNEGRYTYISSAFETIIGYKEGEVLGRYFYEFAAEDDRDAQKENLLRAFAEGVPFKNKLVRKVDRNGREVLLEGSGVPVRGYDGNIKGYRGVCRDVTERIKRDERLRESEEKYRELVNSTVDGVVSVDPDMKIILWNPGAEMIFGYTQEEILGQSVLKIIPERYHDDKGRGLIFPVTAGAVTGKTMEMEGLRKDGEEIPVELTVSAGREKEKHATTIVVRDITARRKVEEENISFRRRLEAILDSSEDFIFFKDAECRYVVVNTTGGVFFHREMSEIVGKTDTDLVAPEDAEVCRKSDETALREGTAALEEQIGGRIFSVVKKKIVDDKGRLMGIAGIIRDITVKKRFEDKQQKLMKDLEDINQIMVGRELMMIELKREINRLSEEAGKGTPYEAEV